MDFLHAYSLADEMRAVGPIAPRRCAKIMELRGPGRVTRAGCRASGHQAEQHLLASGSAGEVAKVIDFGIAKVLGEESGDVPAAELV